MANLHTRATMDGAKTALDMAALGLETSEEKYE